MVVVVGFVLFFQSSTLFVVAVATVPLSTGIVWAFFKPFARRYRRLRGEAADVQSGLVEAVGGIAAIKAMNAQTRAFEDFEKRQMKAIWTGCRSARRDSRFAGGDRCGEGPSKAREIQGRN